MLKWIAVSNPSGRCVRVVVESTGKLSQRFAYALRGRGLPEVCIVNPRLSKAYGTSMGVREKTDRIDSAILAAYGEADQCEPAQSASGGEEKLRELTRMRKSYVEEVKSWENRLRETTERMTRRSIERTIRHLKGEIAELDKAIEALVERDEAMSFQVECLKKIRCVKQVVATTVTAELGDLRAYSRTKLVGRVGLFGCLHESGTSVKKRTRLAKGGCEQVRTALYMAATSVWSSKGELRKYAARLEARGMTRMAVNMALMRKLLLMCRAVVISGGLYDEKFILEGARS